MPPLHWTLLLVGYLVVILLLIRYQRQARRFRKAAVRLDQLPLPVLRLELDQLLVEKYLAGGARALIKQLHNNPEAAKELLRSATFRPVNPSARKHWQGDQPLQNLINQDQLAFLIERTSHNSKTPLRCHLPDPQQLANLYISNLHPNRHLTAIVVPIHQQQLELSEIA